MSLLPTNHSFLARFGRIVATNKLSIGSENQQHLKAYFGKEGLALKTFLTLAREGKRKRGFSATSSSMAEPIPPEEIANLHVADPPDSKTICRRKDQHDEAQKLSASVFVNSRHNFAFSRLQILEKIFVLVTSFETVEVALVSWSLTETQFLVFNQKVDASLLRFLVGKGASTKESIERNAGVSLRIPSAKDAKTGKQAVLVQGQSQDALDEATRQVLEVIDEAIKSPQLQYSHFISIPLALHSKLLDSVVEFQKSVLESVASSNDDSGKSSKGIDKSIFVKPATFHLTLLMLKLWNEERVQAAADCLQKVMPRVHEALEDSPLIIKLTGVDCMKGNPAKAHVLYADVEPNDQALRLIEASQVITDAFTEAGLVMDKDQAQTLKLHATLMNTTQRSGGGHGTRFKKRRIPFDATEIVAKYEQYEWGEYHVAEAHLSQRFVYDENGYYHCCASIPFPQISSHVSTS